MRSGWSSRSPLASTRRRRFQAPRVPHRFWVTARIRALTSRVCRSHAVPSQVDRVDQGMTIRIKCVSWNVRIGRPMITPADRQAERCPYPRPFSPDFDECPAFQAIAFIAADSRNQQPGSYYTCRHLTPGNDAKQRGRYCPRCALGTREQRMQWLAQVTPARLEVVRALQREFDEFSLPHR